MTMTIQSEKRLKQRAKDLKKSQKNITHSQALNLIAQECGFENWQACQKQLADEHQANFPTPQISLNFVADADVEMNKDDFEALDQERFEDHSPEIKQKINSNKKVLINTGVEFSFFEPTITGLKKSILDATQPVRTLFEIEKFHIYSQQKQGTHAKILKDAVLLSDDQKITSKISMYRPETKKGDPRMWFRKLKEIASPKEIIAITIYQDKAYLFNLTRLDLSLSLQSENSEVGRYLREISTSDDSVTFELLARLKELARRPLKSLRTGDTGVGYTLETHLGIVANSSKLPDYKGIEIKAGRGGKNRSNLFAQVADWSISPCKSSTEILNKFGYERDEDFKLYCTVSTQKENSQGLRFIYDRERDQLQEWYNDQELVAVWPGNLLRNRLKEKHTETFWVHANSTIIEGIEYFHLKSVTHTKVPLLSQLMPLIESGVITMDHLIKRNSKGRVTEKGPLFKIKKSDLDLLFPKPVLIQLNDSHP